jgi:hypothetical protein
MNVTTVGIDLAKLIAGRDCTHTFGLIDRLGRRPIRTMRAMPRRSAKPSLDRICVSCRSRTSGSKCCFAYIVCGREFHKRGPRKVSDLLVFLLPRLQRIRLCDLGIPVRQTVLGILSGSTKPETAYTLLYMDALVCWTLMEHVGRRLTNKSDF